jgi:uncharacterized protein (DUF302 family)
MSYYFFYINADELEEKFAKAGFEITTEGDVMILTRGDEVIKLDMTYFDPVE